MRNEIMNTEDLYTSQFSIRTKREYEIIYRDEKLPNMYYHNYTELIDPTKMIEAITKGINNQENLQKQFFMLTTYESISNEILVKYTNVRLDRLDVMELPAKNYVNIKANNDCIIFEPSEERYPDCIEFDIINNKEMGDFARLRIERKMEIYKRKSTKYFVCLKDEKIIGSCELFMNGSIAKIDDFGVLEDYQRKGYGSTILRHLIEVAYKNGVETVYLTTDHADTAKDMYLKCGFTKIGEKQVLFFDLNK